MWLISTLITNCVCVCIRIFCLTYFYASQFLLVSVLVVYSVGAVIGFVANSGVRTSFDNLPSTLTSTVTGIRDYLDNINQVHAQNKS